MDHRANGEDGHDPPHTYKIQNLSFVGDERGQVIGIGEYDDNLQVVLHEKELADFIYQRGAEERVGAAQDHAWFRDAESADLDVP